MELNYFIMTTGKSLQLGIYTIILLIHTIIIMLCEFFQMYITSKIKKVSRNSYKERYDKYEKIKLESEKQIEILRNIINDNCGSQESCINDEQRIDK